MRTNDFLTFLESYYQGVKGVYVLDSGKKGKNIGILAITHGNEPVGLQVFYNLLEKYKLQNIINNGKIFFIGMNLLAYEKYSNGDSSCRFIDADMNRIYNQNHLKDSYENQRFNELIPIFEQLDVVIDLHSISKNDQFIGIVDEGNLEISKKLLDVNTILIDSMKDKSYVLSYFANKGKIGFGIECGNHKSSDAYQIGITNVLNVLKEFNIIQGEIEKRFKILNMLKFKSEIIPKNNEFLFAKDYQGFTSLKVGEFYAKDGDFLLINFKENTYIGLTSKNPKKSISAGFLFEKISK